MEYILIGLIVGVAFYYLIRKIRKEIKKGQCASCPLYDKCDSKEKV
ncbi:FeoB-associated Cys-rich membrane protein [Persephonella sp.]